MPQDRVGPQYDQGDRNKEIGKRNSAGGWDRADVGPRLVGHCSGHAGSGPEMEHTDLSVRPDCHLL